MPDTRLTAAMAVVSLPDAPGATKPVIRVTCAGDGLVVAMELHLDAAEAFATDVLRLVREES